MKNTDGLKLATIKPYAEQKHKLLSYYASLFAKAIRDKWDQIYYLDLFAGPGKAIVEGTSRIVNTSPLLVLDLEDKFDKYIFCDFDSDNVEALRERINRDYSDMNIHVISGDINDEVNTVIKEMPIQKGNRLLGFCFLDPFKMGNLRFSTIKELTVGYMDFLILIPTGMDAKRGEPYYQRDENDTVDLFLGGDGWRERWKSETIKKKDFGDFIIEEYNESMKSIGFIDMDLSDTVPIKNSKNQIIYRLAFFSKNNLGVKLFKESSKYSNPQLGMFD